MLLYACTIFLSAFLLFEVQPMIGKIILPWFGGSAAVWSTCLLFFQASLLAGYLYAHCSTRYLKPRQQATLHVLLMAASLALLWALSGSAVRLQVALVIGTTALIFMVSCWTLVLVKSERARLFAWLGFPCGAQSSSSARI